MRVTLHESEIRRLLQSPDGPVVRQVVSTGRKVQNAARRRCPVDTGRLRASIHTTVATERGRIVSTTSSPVHYAIYVHEGTRYMRARPFLVDALIDVSPWPVQRHA